MIKTDGSHVRIKATESDALMEYVAITVAVAEFVGAERLIAALKAGLDLYADGDMKCETVMKMESKNAQKNKGDKHSKKGKG